MTKNNNIPIAGSKLVAKVLLRYTAGFLLVCLILFVPAGSLKFWNAWICIGSLFIPMLFVMIYLLLKDPELLQKRIKTDEKEKTQKIFVYLSILVFIALFIIPGLDFRYHWSAVPLWLVIVATIIMITGYSMFFLVIKQNSFASRVIEIQEGQKVIDNGLYSVVRHPMYLATSILYSSSAIVLGSFYALIPAMIIIILLAVRILNEEIVLKNSLPGYEEYMKKVRYRLIPSIW